MTTTSPYGSAPQPTRSRPPVVVPVAPATGWAAADAPRRAFALAALPLAAVVCVLPLLPSAHALGVVEAAWLLVGPMCFYSLARVLRPEPRHPERTPRHLLAAAATSFAVPVLAVLLLGQAGGTGDDVVIGFGSIAAVLGVVTAVWGLVALVVRWFTTLPAGPAPPSAR